MKPSILVNFSGLVKGFDLQSQKSPPDWLKRGLKCTHPRRLPDVTCLQSPGHRLLILLFKMT